MTMCDTDKKKMKPATLPRGQRPALPPKPQFPLIEGLKVKDICHTGDAVSECHGNSSVIEPSRNLTSTIAEPTIALHDTQITKVPPKPPVKPRRTCEKREKIQARLSYGSVEDCNHTHDETSADTLNENSDAWKNDSTPSSWFIQKIHRQTLDKDECKKTDSTSHSSLIRPSPTPRSFYNKPNAEDHNTGSSHDVVGKPEKTDATVPAKPARKGKKHKHGKKDTESGGSVVVIQKVEEGHVAVLGVLPLNSPEEDVENDSKNNSKTEVIESRKKSTPPRPPPPSIGPKPKPRLSLNKKEVQNVAKEGQEKKTGVALKPIEEKQDQDKKTGVALKSIKASTDQQVRSIESLKSDEEKESKEVKDFDHLESDKEKEQSEQTVHLKVADPKSGRKMGESEIKKKSTKKAPPTPSRSDSLTKYIENKVKSGDITAVHSKKEELSSSHKEDVSDQPSGRVRPARPAPPVLPKLKSPITSDRRNSNELKPAKVKPPRPAPPRPPSMKVSVREHSIETTTDSKIVVSTQSEDKTEQPTSDSVSAGVKTNTDNSNQLSCTTENSSLTTDNSNQLSCTTENSSLTTDNSNQLSCTTEDSSLTNKDEKRNEKMLRAKCGHSDSSEDEKRKSFIFRLVTRSNSQKSNEGVQSQGKSVFYDEVHIERVNGGHKSGDCQDKSVVDFTEQNEQHDAAIATKVVNETHYEYMDSTLGSKAVDDHDYENPDDWIKNSVEPDEDEYVDPDVCRQQYRPPGVSIVGDSKEEEAAENDDEYVNLPDSIYNKTDHLQVPKDSIDVKKRKLDKQDSTTSIGSIESTGSYVDMSNITTQQSSDYDVPSSIRQHSDQDENDSSVVDHEFDESSSDDEQDSGPEDDEPISEDEKKKKLDEKKKMKAFNVAQELMTSEKVFVGILELMNLHFRSAVNAANSRASKKIISQEDLNQILYYLPQLTEINQDLLSKLQDRIEKWETCPKISDIILGLCPFLKLYSTTYIKEFDRMTSTLEEQCKKSPQFATVVKEFERSEMCGKLQLRHHMLKPIQRIPQYKLLLQDYIKYLDDDSQEYTDSKRALKLVSEIASHCNNSMKQMENFNKILEIQHSLIGNVNLVQAGRILIKEGELMKHSRRVLQPRMFYLFTDKLFYCTPQAGQYKVKYSLPLVGMKIKPGDVNFQKEFSILTQFRSFSLHASDLDERQEWVDALNKAIDEAEQRRESFLRSQDMPATDFVLGEVAPVWIPDSRATMCYLCTSDFKVTFRRHHCRACGKIVCGRCASKKCALSYLSNATARVCDICYNSLQKQKEEAGSAAIPLSTSNQSSTMNHKDDKSKKRTARAKVLTEIPATTDECDIRGYLYKLKDTKKDWEKFWIVIKDHVLYTYKASEDVAAIKTEPIVGFRVEPIRGSYKGAEPGTTFNVSHPSSTKSVITLRVEDKDLYGKWIDAVTNATVL